MKHVILSFCFLALAVACNTSSEEETGEEGIESLENNEATKDSINMVVTNNVEQETKSKDLQYFTPEIEEKLKEYLTDSLIVAYNNCQAQIKAAKTDLAFGEAYVALKKQSESMAHHIWGKNLPEEKNGSYYPDYILNDFKAVDEATIGMVSTCVAECTEFDFTFRLTDFKPIVESTLGEKDDLFLELMLLADGEYGGTEGVWHAWFERTWDYGGGSLFGSGMHYEFLKKSDDLMRDTDIYNDILKDYIRDAVIDIQHGIYMNSREDVINELEKIIDIEVLDETKMRVLKNMQKRLNLEIDDCLKCPTKYYQFDCKTGDCNWGG